MKVVVVGAGVGGLAVAARLARQGHRVTVCEAAETVGGKLGTYERDGFRFDTGPSLLTMPDVFRELFEDTGGWPSDLELVPCDPLIRHRFADGTRFDSSADPAVMHANLEAWSPGSGEDWARLMTRAQKVWDASRGPFLAQPINARGLVKLAVGKPRDVATIAPHRTLRDLGDDYLRDQRLRTVLDRYATYAGSDPRRAPAALAAIPWVEHSQGGWWIAGGLRRLAEALLTRCLDLGVVVRTSTRVVRIPQPVRGVTLEDGFLAADVVVSNADARHVYTDLLPRKVRGAPSLSGFVLLLALRGETPGLAHHTVLFPETYEDELDTVLQAPVVDPTVYLSRPPGTAPDGHEALFVLVNAPCQGPVDWCREAGYGDHVLDVLEARGVDVRQRLLWSEQITPADLEARTGAVGGAIYGTSSNGPRSAFLRPSNRSPVKGLFLVGGSSHPGGGLPLVALSAAIVARQIG